MKPYPGEGPILPLYRRFHYYWFFFLEHILPLGRIRNRVIGKKSLLTAKLVAWAANTPAQRFEVVTYSGDRSCGNLDLKNPFVLKAAARDWLCTRTWDFDFFSANFADAPMVAIDYHGRNITGDDPRLVGFLRRMRCGEKIILTDLMDHWPSLQSSVDIAYLRSFYRGLSLVNEYRLYLAAAGTGTHLHCEFPGSFLVQISGKKRWRLFHQKFTPHVSPEAVFQSYFQSRIDIDAPDLAKYPLYAYADYSEVTLQPGDILWVPPYYWHKVNNVTDNIAVRYSFYNPFAGVAANPMLFFLNFLARDPSVFSGLIRAFCGKRRVINY